MQLIVIIKFIWAHVLLWIHVFTLSLTTFKVNFTPTDISVLLPSTAENDKIPLGRNVKTTSSSSNELFEQKNQHRINYWIVLQINEQT